MDGDGAFAHYPRTGAWSEQAAYDMAILRLIRAKWVEMINESAKAHKPGERHG